MYKELMAYQKAFKLAMQVFEVSKAFPKEERYALTDQIRRSSRSVCANIAEGYRKRLYEKHFIAKYRMQIWKIAKPPFGSILQLLATT